MSSKSRHNGSVRHVPPAASQGRGSAQIPALLVPVAVAVLTYAHTARFGFIWDDPIVLDQLRQFRSLADLIVLPEAVPKFYYRPLTFATLLLDRALGGETPYWFHLSVIGWNAITTGLVFLLARNLLGPRHVVEASLGALLFAVHPIHVESVAWIAGRSDVIATAFVIAAVLVSARTNVAWTVWLAGLLAFAGMLAKEVAIAALVLVPLRDLLFERRLYVTSYVPLLIAAGAYFSLRYNFLSAVTGGLPPASSPADQLRDVVAAFGWYAVKLLFPLNLNAYVPEVPSGAAYVLAGLLSGAAMSIAAGWSVKARKPLVAFAVLWFAITIAPSLLVILRRSASALVADRYLYLPSVGLALFVAWALAQVAERAPRRRVAARGLVAAIAVVGAVLSIWRSEVWSDDLAFWSDVAHKSPDVALPQRELASAYMRRERLDEAERALQAALEAPVNPEGPEGRVMIYGNLANLYVRQNRLDEAEAAFRDALAIARHPYLYSGLGRVAMKRAEMAQARGDGKEVMRQIYSARDALVQAVALDPNDHKSRVLLGQVYFNLGLKNEARHQFEAALRIESTGGIADIARSFLAKMGG